MLNTQIPNAPVAAVAPPPVAHAATTTPGADLLEAGGTMLTREEVEDPDAFLATDRGQAWLGRLKANAYYTRWYDHQRSPHGLKWCNELAEEILQVRAGGGCLGEVHDALEAHFSGGEEPEEAYDANVKDDVERAIGRIASDLDDLREDDDTVPELDADAWEEAARDSIVEHMADEDTSTVMDMFDSYDRFELLIRLGSEEGVTSNRPWAEFSDLSIDGGLQTALAGLGYTLADYRRMSGNKGGGSGTSTRVRRRATPLVDERELRELVSESCSSNFGIYLYAMVPLVDLVALDPSRPFVLERYSIASYNGGSGTFYNINREEGLVVMPGDGVIEAAGRYGPDETCGFVHSYFQSSMTNIGGEEAN